MVILKIDEKGVEETNNPGIYICDDYVLLDKSKLNNVLSKKIIPPEDTKIVLLNII